MIGANVELTKAVNILALCEKYIFSVHVEALVFVKAHSVPNSTRSRTLQFGIRTYAPSDSSVLGVELRDIYGDEIVVQDAFCQRPTVCTFVVRLSSSAVAWKVGS